MLWRDWYTLVCAVLSVPFRVTHCIGTLIAHAFGPPDIAHVIQCFFIPIIVAILPTPVILPPVLSFIRSPVPTCLSGLSSAIHVSPLPSSSVGLARTMISVASPPRSLSVRVGRGIVGGGKAGCVGVFHGFGCRLVTFFALFWRGMVCQTWWAFLAGSHFYFLRFLGAPVRARFAVSVHLLFLVLLFVGCPHVFFIFRGGVGACSFMAALFCADHCGARRPFAACAVFLGSCRCLLALIGSWDP